MIGILVPFVVFGAEIFEFYNVGDDGVGAGYGTYWIGQTFTPTIAHKITSVKLKLLRLGTPNVVVVGIRATDVEEKPTGADLCSGTIDGNTLTTDGSGEWYEIVLGSGCILSANTTYAIVVRATNGSVGNDVRWRLDTTGTYTGGSYQYSGDSGVNWTSQIAKDYVFEEWGEIEPPPPTPIVPLPAGYTTTILASVGELFTDLSSLVGLGIGLPMAFWGVRKVISLARFR